MKKNYWLSGVILPLCFFSCIQEEALNVEAAIDGCKGENIQLLTINHDYKNIEVYGEMHRFIPYLAKNAGFTHITEKPVHHQKRKYGKSKFGVDRFVNGFLDLLSIWFLCTFGKNPMHFFGLTGILMFLTGGFIAVWLIVSKLIHQSNGMDFRPVTEQPLFYLALVAVLIGVQLFLSGFISELVSRNSSERNHYNIKDTIR